MVKNLPANAGDAKGTGLILWVGKSHWRRKWQPAPVFLPGKFHGQKNLAGYTVYGVAKSRTQLSLSTYLSTKLNTFFFRFLSVTDYSVQLLNGVAQRSYIKANDFKFKLAGA